MVRVGRFAEPRTILRCNDRLRFRLNLRIPAYLKRPERSKILKLWLKLK
jgi:hypothetical protein